MTKPTTPPERLYTFTGLFHNSDFSYQKQPNIPCVEYVRADLYESAQAEKANLVQITENIRSQLKAQEREIARLREALENIRDKNYSTVVVARKYAREALSPATTTLWCNSDTDGEKPS